MGKHEAASRKRARGLLGRAGYKSGGHVTPAEAVHKHEANMHPGKKPTALKDGGRISGALARQRLDRARRGSAARIAKAAGGGLSEANDIKESGRPERAGVAREDRARGGRTNGKKGKGGNHVHIEITPGGGAGAGAANPAVLAAAHKQGMMQGAQLAAAHAQKPPMAGGPPPGGMPPGGPPPGGMPPGAPMMPPPPGAPPGGPMPPMARGGRNHYKRGGRTEAATEAAFHEIKENPPKILAKTRAKSGPKRAEAQRVAIGLSKARAAGADIPQKAKGGSVGERQQEARDRRHEAGDKSDGGGSQEREHTEEREDKRPGKATGGGVGLGLTKRLAGTQAGSGGGKGRLAKRDYYEGVGK